LVIGCLSQQPGPELLDLWEACSHPRADDPVGFLRVQGEIEGSNQAAVQEIPGGKGRASKRNTLAIDGRVYQHARLVQNRAA